MKTLASLLICMIPITAQTHSAATNFTVDLLGSPDNRPDTWGTAGSVVKIIKFKPPIGHRVRILKVYGDLLLWPIGRVGSGNFAGVLFGLQTTAPDGSIRMDLGADNTMLYIQDATGGEVRRSAFDYDVSIGGLLQPDNMLLVKMAVWLNNTGLPIHIEPSFVMVYRFEKNDNNTANQSIAKPNRPVVLEHASVGPSKPSILHISARPEIRP
jgi:hypothetical protein